MGNADAYTGAFYDKIEENKRKKEEYEKWLADAPARQEKFDNFVEACRKRSNVLNNIYTFETMYTNYLQGYQDDMQTKLDEHRKIYDDAKAKHDESRA